MNARSRTSRSSHRGFSRIKDLLASHGRIDPTFFSLLIILLLFGLVILTSASSALGQYNHNDSFYYLKHQVINGVVIGGIVFFVMSRIDYHIWRRYAFPMVVVSIIMLLLVFTPLGYAALGAKRWINIFGFNFQPSEVVKMTFLIYLAAWFEKKGRQVEDSSYGFAPFLVMLGSLVVIIAGAQKDLGTMLVVAAIAISIYFVAGAPWRHLMAIAGGGIAAVAALIAIAPYRIARFTVFLHPDKVDVQGAGYHITQALIAIGSGGIFGVGLGHSRQKYNYVPEVATDSIFAILSEELGFIFSLVVVLLYLALVWRMLHIARKAPDAFGKYLAVGVTAWIGFQAFVNIGAMLSLWPLTGIPLPFISYGSTSLIMLCGATGLLANISRKV